MRLINTLTHKMRTLAITLTMSMLVASQSFAACDIVASGTYIDAEDFSSSTNANPGDPARFFSEVTADGATVLKSGTYGSTATPPGSEIKFYEVNFPTAGTYYFWMRGRTPSNGTDDEYNSMFYTVDSEPWRAWRLGTPPARNTFGWFNTMQTAANTSTVNAITVTAGTHTIKIAMREAHTEIDGFTLSTNAAYDPTTTTPQIYPNNCGIGTLLATPPTQGPSTYVGYSASSTTFTVKNTGATAITNISITDNATWLETTPTTIANLDPGQELLVTVSYPTTSLAAGTFTANITVASSTSANEVTVPVTLLVHDTQSTAACGEIPLYAQNLVNPAIMVQLDTSGSMDSDMFLLADKSNPVTPDLKDIVQEIVNLSGWASHNSMAFVIKKGSTANTGTRKAWSFDGQANGSPKLEITYTSGGITEVIESSIDLSANDAQMKASYQAGLAELELGANGYPVGLLFGDIQVPPGATIVKAEIKFIISSGTNIAADFTVQGVNQANVTALTQTLITASTGFVSPTVAWNNVQAWDHKMSRLDIARDVLKDVFKDRSISWGFGSWAGGDGQPTTPGVAGNYYTKYWVGVHEHDDTHQDKLQDAIADTVKITSSGWTPLVPSMKAAEEYFSGTRKDLQPTTGYGYNEYYTKLSCRPRILVIVTDGLGNTGSDLAKITAETNNLINLPDGGVSVVTVGFGLSDASQLREIAKLSQAAGKTSATDYLYALHDENTSGEGIPFLAQSREEFIDAMNSIVTNVKAQVFHGSNPAPTTSITDLTERLLLSSTFDASDWSGNLTATVFDATTGVLESAPLWSAKAAMPAATSIKGFYFDSLSSTVKSYTDASLATDNFLCKPLGDIINSTPKIVNKPPYLYNFDSYKGFKYNSEVYNRDPIVYINANDGALHAFSLADGVEKWRFYPSGVLAKLNEMGLDPSKNMCSPAYCHRFLLDGSPQVADIYTGASSKWKTILTSGFGRGGANYYALDITYGLDFSSTSGSKASNYLWEFTDADLGLAISPPQTTRVNTEKYSGSAWGLSSTESSWVTYFSSGPAVDAANQGTKKAYLYALRAWDKAQIWRSNTSTTVADTYKVKLTDTANNIPATPTAINVEYNDQKNDHIYLGDRYGDMFRVKNIGEGQLPTVAKLFESPNIDHRNPITAKASYAFSGDADKDNIDDVRIYFGTGKYQDQIDKTTTYPQYFFGLLDQEGSKASPYVMNDLVHFSTQLIQARAVDASGNPVGSLMTYRTIDCAAADKDANGKCNTAGNSWVLDLLTPVGTGSERAITQPLVFGGVVYIATFIPDGNACEGNGKAYILALDWKTGSARDPESAVFDINGDGRFDAADSKVKDASGVLHNVVGFAIGDGVPADPVMEGDDILILGTTGDAGPGGSTKTKIVKVNDDPLKPKLKAWRQLLN